MAADAATFIRGLGLAQVDLLGFSLGGMLAQLRAVHQPDLVGRLIIAGAAPRGGEEHLLAVVGDAFALGASDVRLPLFFTPSETSQHAGRAFVARATARMHDRDSESGVDVSEPQAKAIIGWCARKSGKARRPDCRWGLMAPRDDASPWPQLRRIRRDVARLVEL